MGMGVSRLSGSWLGELAGWMEEVRVIDKQRNEDVQRIMMDMHQFTAGWRAAYWLDRHQHAHRM